MKTLIDKIYMVLLAALLLSENVNKYTKWLKRGATWLMLLFSAVLTVTVFFTSEKILSFFSCFS